MHISYAKQVEYAYEKMFLNYVQAEGESIGKIGLFYGRN